MAQVSHPYGPPRPAVQWTPPRFGWYKLNVDAIFNSEELKACCAMVMRDRYGQVVVSSKMTFWGMSCSLHAELRAILFGLNIVKHQGLRVQYLESDSLLAVQQIEKGHDSFSMWSNIVFLYLFFKKYLWYLFLLSY